MKNALNRSRYLAALLVVVAMLFIAVGCASSPPLEGDKTEACRKAAEAALMNLEKSQEAFYLDYGMYTVSMKDLIRVAYHSPATNVLVQLTWADGSGWRARAKHNQCEQWVVYDSTKGGLQP